jgi:hypothetical protein
MRIICLANSYKNQGRCIAGIAQESGQWIRPISDLDDGRIPLDSNFIQAQNINILDILDIPIDSNKKSGHEIENIGYKNLPWQRVGTIEIASLLPYCEDELLYPDYKKAIPYELLKSDAPVRTLQLIQVKSFSCHKNNRGKWRGTIADEKFHLENIDFSITDPITLEKLEHNPLLSPHCLICLSFGQPWQPDPITPNLCYRLVAGVVELLPELEQIIKEMAKSSWSIQQGKEYLKQEFGKTSRYQLTEAEAKKFLDYLRSLG